MENTPYAAPMSRRTSRQQPPQGRHLASLRQEAGLTQAELAKAIGASQQNVAFWEFSDKPPRSEVLPKLAVALGVAVETLLTPNATPQRRGGPKGHALRAFEAVSALPRAQQAKVLELVDALVQQFRRKAG
jgi:transcriptional regulator with XRE-family HTH domain